MGIHYPFDYVGYEVTFLATFIDLIDNFCTGCHTNDDVGGDCSKCPVGNLALASRKYLLEAYESDTLKEEAEILRKIKKEIKKIKPDPAVNPAGFIFNKTRGPDKLLKLRELLRDLKFCEAYNYINFRMKHNVDDVLIKKLFKDLERKKDKLMQKIQKELLIKNL